MQHSIYIYSLHWRIPVWRCIHHTTATVEQPLHTVYTGVQYIWTKAQDEGRGQRFSTFSGTPS